MPLGLSWSSEMGGKAKVVGVKRVKEGMPEEEWDESMLLPGDIIEGVAPVVADADEDSATFTSAKGRSELSSLLGRLGRQSGYVWVKVRRGDAGFLLRARVAPHRSSTLHRRYTLCADRDDRHVAMLADLTMDRCAELQEMSRKVVNIDFGAFSMKKGIKYDWKKKVGTYLPDRQSTVISSILFMPLPDEHKVEAVMTRSMAWFSAAVSSGAPLIFVNIQTEQIIVSGFICINSVSRGLAADRAGVRKLYREASKAGHLVLISRLDGRSLIPSEVSAKGLIHCCDHNDIKERLAAAMEQMEEVHLHIMAWPDQKSSTSIPTTMGPSTLLPPSTRKSRTASSNEPDESS